MRTIPDTMSRHSVPTEEDVRQAMSDGDRIQETDGGAGTPIIGEDAPFYSTILGLGMPGLVVGSRWVPAVPPKDAGSVAEPPESLPLTRSPGASFPRPLVRPWTTRSQRARGLGRGLTERLLGRRRRSSARTVTRLAVRLAAGRRPLE